MNRFRRDPRILAHVTTFTPRSRTMSECDLFEAAEAGDVEEVRRMIEEQGIDPQTFDFDGCRMLLVAAKSGDVALAEYMMGVGNNVLDGDAWGVTSLMHAIERGNPEMMEFFMWRGADVNVVDYRGWTALMHAACCGDVADAEYLLEWGADIHHKDDSGSTALMVAAEHGNTEVIQCLVEQGVDVMATNKKGEDALQIASRYKHADFVDLLAPHLPQTSQPQPTSSKKRSERTPVEAKDSPVDESPRRTLRSSKRTKK